MQKIAPFIWFETEAREAAKLYTSIFKDGKILSSDNLENTPSGKVEFIPIEIMGHQFTLMSAGPYQKPNPSISFLIYCETEEEIESLWQGLSNGGKALMPLNTYPFAEKYGWIEDKFGVSWQLMLSNASEKQKVSPLLMFTGERVGKTLEAIDFYTATFKNSQKIIALHYDEGEGDKTEYIKHAEFLLEGQLFMAMDSSLMHNFSFNDAISLVIDCDNQEEVDYYWAKLTADGGSEGECGWLKDKFGVSWQVVPKRLNELLNDPDPVKSKRVMEAMLKMKKIVISDLEKAYTA